MIVGIVAVVLAVTGVAVAGPGKKGVGSTIDKTELALSQQTAWAKVEIGGQALLHSKGVSSVAVPERPGVYHVTFPGTVGTRPVSITPRGFGVPASPEAVSFTYRVCPCGNGVVTAKTVQVQFRDSRDFPAPHAFDITILPK